MTTRLEDDLTAGLREHAAGVHLTRDLLGAARDRHRRRTLVTRAASATGTVGLAGAVATVLAVQGPVTAGEPAGPPVPSALAPTGVTLDAATVSARVTRALTESERQVVHIRMRITLGGRSGGNDLWRDPVTGDQRATGPKVPGSPRQDVVVDVDGDRQTTTVVNHDEREWWAVTQPVIPPPNGRPESTKDAGPLGDFSPAGLRESLRKGYWRLVGEERLDGRATVHLRVTDAAQYGEYDLWVDAESYAVVRRVVARADDPPFRLVEDYEYLPRTPVTLKEVAVQAVPKGYRHVDPPEPDLSPGPKG
jgi:hypothetical protein